MNLSEKVAILAFLAVIASVYVSTGGILLRALVRKLSGRNPVWPRRGRWFRRAVFAAALLGGLCYAYGYFIEPYWLEVTHVSLTSEKLAADARPIRLVHISDLHCDETERLELRLPEVIAELNPDLILFTGDAVNSAAGLESFRRCMSRLSEVAPVFAVHGNWRLPGDTYAGLGVRLLDAEVAKVQIGGTEVYVAGVSAGQTWAIEPTLAKASVEALTIFLYHYPDELDGVARLGTDLYLAGHTHGGQVALPFYGALVTLSKFGKRYEAGLYRQGKTHLYVNRGIGMEGRHAPRVRFCARPEVTLIEISPAR